MGDFFNHWLTRNVITVLGFALLAWVVWSGSHHERWQRAWRRFRSDRVGIISLAIVALYLAIGALEVAGALGLVLPAVTGIAPVLVPLAAVGLVLVMVGAVVVHLRRGDGLAGAAPAIVLGLLAVFVAWGRFGAYAF